MSRFRTSAVIAAALLVPAAAPADLLVTRDGATIETRGGWKVEGRRVVFTLPNGTLSSLRAEQVDLDASNAATARAAAPPQAPAVADSATPAEPVLRITEADIPPMTDLDDDGLPDEAPATSTTAAGNVPLEVSSWDKVPIGDGEGVAIFGTLRNSGNETVIAPTLSVSVYGPEGGLLALDEAEVNLTAIPAGKSANFRAEFPGLPDFTAVKFNPAGRGYQGNPAATADTGAAEGVAGEDEVPQGMADEPPADASAEPPAG